MKNFRFFLVTLAFVGLSIGTTYAQNAYIIDNYLGVFRTTYNGSSLGNSATLQNAIDAIKTYAAGQPCTIQFGNGGTDTLKLGGGDSTLIKFDGGTNGNDWGLITLTGNASSTSTATYSVGIMRLINGVSVNTQAELTGKSGILFVLKANTTLTISGGTVTGATCAIANAYDATINITGGTVTGGATNYSTIANYSGTLNISGGTLENIGGGQAVSNDGGKVTVSGGIVQGNGMSYGVYSRAILSGSGEVIISGNAVVRSENLNATQGTIMLSTPSYAGQSCSQLKISGGTVENTAGGKAIYCRCGDVNISGGTVSSASNGIAILSKSIGDVNISGGTISETIVNDSTGAINISGGNVTVLTDAIVNNFTGTINITGGTVQTTTVGNFSAIYNPNAGTVNVSGGTVAAFTGGFGIFNASTGTVNLSGGIVRTTTRPAVSNTNSGGFLSLTVNAIVFAYGTGEANVINNSGTYFRTGDAVFVAWNDAAGTTTYQAGTSDDIYKFPPEASAVWAKQGDNNGISVAYNANTGFIQIEGVTVEGETGIEELQLANCDLQVYPNPTNDILYFSLETAYEITDLQGRTLQKSDKAVKSVNINRLPAGVYFVTLTTETGRIVKKITKK